MIKEDQQTSLLSLKNYTRDGSLNRFLALEWPDKDLPKQLYQELTPELMQWDDHLWIFDLKFSLHFWQRQARTIRRSPQDLLRQILDAYSRPYRVYLCEHPWQAALIFAGEGIKNQDLEKFSITRKKPPQESDNEMICLEAPYGRRLLKELTWDAWLEATVRLSQHAEKKKLNRFRINRIKPATLKLKRAMQRLGVTGPLTLPVKSSEAIKRRFGADIATLWQWTLTVANKEPEARLLFKDENFLDFPWISRYPSPKPECKRSFDQLMITWDDFEAYLCEDFNRLCQNQDWASHERVSELSWNLTLFHGEQVSLTVYFRNPHSLHSEQTQQKTALAQTRLVYENFASSHRTRDEDLDLPDEIPIIAWKLRVEQRMTIPQLSRSLFASDSEDKLELEHILTLENKLPMGFELYGLDRNFDPLLAYGHRTKIPPLEKYEHLLWSLAAVHRPLFIYKERQRLSSRDFSKIFLERSCRSWWQQNTEAFQDYYRILDRYEHCSYWASCDIDKKWFKYGIYS